ncbi:MAG: AbrB/MazE/SpoVT family DNA-binding domain-containing protein [Chloroflexi bacterium]|nr:MAG: AbrB/MazE/SpoVT family DNA-binding domain-containing protein [Chloroflexota bacterium]
MLRKVFKTGNSMVVSLPREMLELLGVAEGADVSVELDREHGQIVIRPMLPIVAGVDEAFARQLNQFIDECRPALEALAR